MGQFAEEVLIEYPKLLKRKTWKKDVFYRIRVVRRKLDGLMRIMLDIREYIITEKRAMFTESGVYFTREEVDGLIQTLLHARKEYMSGTESRGGIKNSFGNSKKEQLP